MLELTNVYITILILIKFIILGCKPSLNFNIFVSEQNNIYIGFIMLQITNCNLQINYKISIEIETDLLSPFIIFLCVQLFIIKFNYNTPIVYFSKVHSNPLYSVIIPFFFFK